ncbi:hypothetical protein ABIF38_000597 [Bradyrhizobium japonicum]|uniref:Uncharacterized protein n=2 Tax=Bradyrhizobium elkanii TaxID=29448 RepID=A0ABV4ESJ3_BRAEL|nr:hypothetical protein [Bradyrhizobium elkanii]MBP2429442.1 hypothetical protein [Bradyrhizobium elkanii]MCP1737086.1 hypothetical protein [Bradyrhizobium elkanii]MCP1755132.1 hypothetical protein [Bradyrhizobium elkanii]MCP1980649.1 hypothetical protein [Bradyrhizobium elkanii]MCS3572426.1 hypothetical protein [Bradyrhizobium elkanii]
MANSAPVVTIGNHSLLYNQWQKMQPWLTYADSDGNPAQKFQFWDGGSAANSAYFWTSTNDHWAANTTIEVAASDLSDVWVRAGAVGGTETLWVRAFDGTDWGNWTSFTLTTIPNTVPVVTVPDVQLHTNTWTQAKNWLTYSDANGDAATKYQFWDSGTSATSAYFWTSTNDHWAANTTIEVAAADLADVWIKGGSTTGAETFWVRAFDGTDWSNWDSFTLTSVNTPPVVTAGDHSIHIDQWVTVDNWLTKTDANGDAITKYQFWDSGTAATSAYFWTPDNSHWAANTTIDVSAADLANVWIHGGSTTGSETMWVRGFDGTEWSNWDTFTVTSTPNTVPVATINDQALHVNQWVKPQGWLTATDAEGDTITKYQFWDAGAGATSAYFWTPDNSHWAANTTIDVSASDLANVWIKGGSTTGSETMWVRAFDGTAWSNWDSFTLTSTNTAPTATINDHTLNAAQWAQLVNWTTASDADGDAITQYQLWDGGGAATSAYFWTPDNSHWASSTVIDVSASDLANVWVRGGTTAGTDSMFVRAFDGTSWSTWDSFTVTSLANHAPDASISNQTLHVNEWSQVGNLVSYADADANPATAYQFWDGGGNADSGYFWTSANSHWAASTVIDVNAADLDDVWMRGGATTGTETMYVRAYDGIDWSAWHAFTLSTIV